jgi:MoaA/NifB/PqqE/SkfB family radical SAM enzyme
MHVGRNAYLEITDRAAARDLFIENMERVEIETHSYCNRRCSYCPNVIGDRIGPNQHLAPDLWEMILSNLEEIGYAKFLALNYYNEPLADRAILDRIREARARLPKARIMIYTNGDYLEPKFIDELAEAGLSYLHVSIHLKRGDVYSDLYVLNRINEISVRMGIPARITQLKSREFVIATAAHPTLEIEVRALNFESRGTDRGGLIEDIKTASHRTAACVFPFQHFVVSYTGDVVPCCHIRADRPEHAGYVLGNLRDYGSIFQAYTSVTAAGVHPKPESRAQMDKIYRAAIATL